MNKGVDRPTALMVARRIGCSGAHQQGDGWMPCSSQEELTAVSRAAEGEKGARRRRGRLVSSRRGDGWERLCERPVTSLRSGGAGITSGRASDDIGATGSSGTAVAGGVMGGVVDGSLGATYSGSGGTASMKALPDDRDMDGWIYEGTPKKRFVGVQAVVEGAEEVVDAAKPMSTSRRRERKPDSGVALRVEDRKFRTEEARAAAGRAAVGRVQETVTALSDDRNEATVSVKPNHDVRTRYGRKPTKPEQELTPEGKALREKRWSLFPRAVKPKGLKSAVSKRELDAAGVKTTAEFFGLNTRNRSLNHPEIPEERRQVYDAIAQAMVYGDPEDPFDLPVSEEPTLHLMGGGPASGKSYLRQAGFFDVPDRSQAAHIDTDEGRKMLPEYDDMLREMGGSVEASEALGGINHFEATHVARLATDLAFRNGHDVVLDSTGDGGPFAFAARIQQAREAGYKIKAHFATTSISKAVEAAKERAKKENRGVDPKELIDTHVDVSRAVLWGLKNRLFDELTLVDNQDFDAPVVFAEFKAGQLTIHNMEMWDAFIKKAVAEPIFYPHDYFTRNPFSDEDLDDWRAKAATRPKITGKNADRIKEQGEDEVVVLAPDKKTVWYRVTASQATNADYRKMLATEPPADLMPMKVNNDALYRVRSGRLMPHIPDLPADDRIPAMTRRDIRIAAMTNQTLREAGIEDNERHQKEYDEIRASVLAMLKEGIQPEVQPHFVETMPEGFSAKE